MVERPIATQLIALAAFAALALAPAALADKAVSISDSRYVPAVVTVKRGEVVTWTNDGKRNHTVTSDTGKTMDSGELEPGGAFATLFTKAGRYPYRSAAGSDRMQGVVVVLKTAVATATTTTGPTPPSGTLPAGFSPKPGFGTTGATKTAAGKAGTTRTDWLVRALLIVLALVVAGSIALVLRRRRS